jgi:hypothetical protein
MEQDCPECGLVNPHSATYCACGYDFCAKQLDPSRARPPVLVRSAWDSRLSNVGGFVATVGITLACLGSGGLRDLARTGLALALTIVGVGLFALFRLRADSGTATEDATRTLVGFCVGGMVTTLAHVATVWVLWVALARPAGLRGELSFWVFVGGLALVVPTSIVGGLVGVRLFSRRG